MNRNEMAERQRNILEYLSFLPRKILSLHGRDNMTELVLHNLCHEKCFNLRKAAFFVDNPDFNCVKGIAGFNREENCTVASCDGIWDHPDRFSERMKELPFNSKVRQFQQCSIVKGSNNKEGLVRDIASNLVIANPLYISMPLKYDNHGLLVFEKADQSDMSSDTIIGNGLALLGFCPIF